MISNGKSRCQGLAFLAPAAEESRSIGLVWFIFVTLVLNCS